MKKKRNAVILMKKRNNYGKNVMVGTSGIAMSAKTNKLVQFRCFKMLLRKTLVICKPSFIKFIT